MNTVIIYTLGMSLLLMTILFLTYLGKYKTLKKKTKDIISNFSNPIRKGYYVLYLKTRNGSEKFESTVYVKELDRYTNGESKVEIEKSNQVLMIEYRHQKLKNIFVGNLRV